MSGEASAGSSFRHRERSFGSLTQQVVQELGIAIVTGKFSGDKPFPTESAICQQFGASRSIVREAIKVLNAKGLLSARPRRGTRVRGAGGRCSTSRPSVGLIGQLRVRPRSTV